MDKPLKSTFRNNRWTVYGVSQDGTIIKVILEKDGSLVTAFPDIELLIGNI